MQANPHTTRKDRCGSPGCLRASWMRFHRTLPNPAGLPADLQPHRRSFTRYFRDCNAFEPLLTHSERRNRSYLTPSGETSVIPSHPGATNLLPRSRTCRLLSRARARSNPGSKFPAGCHLAPNRMVKMKPLAESISGYEPGTTRRPCRRPKEPVGVPGEAKRKQEHVLFAGAPPQLDHAQPPHK